jgi:hypothetical protein
LAAPALRQPSAVARLLAQRPEPLRSTDTRLRWIKAVLSLALMAGFLLSTELWFTDRAYPLTPAAGVLPEIPSPLDHVLLGALLALLILVIVSSRPRKYLVAFVALAIVLALGDQSRWQPWLYQYLFMAAALALYPWEDAERTNGEAVMAVCRIIVAGVYFWSGLQKANASFLSDTFPWLVEPLTASLPGSVASVISDAGFLVPIFEAGIGVALLTRRYRNYGVIAALMMHAFILLSIGPFGHDVNSVVWPWNVAMAALVVLLFWDTGAAGVREAMTGGTRWLRIAVVALFAAMPALSFVGAWDSYLSSTLYSGKTARATIFLTPEAAERVPAAARRYALPDGDVHVLSLFDWSMGELNVPPYPEPRIFKSVARELCSQIRPATGLELAVRDRPGLFTTERTTRAYGCRSL